MSQDYRRKTDEELIIIVNQYMQDHPNATRNQVVLNSHGSHQRVRDLDKKGLISLPKAQTRGGVWRKYFYIQSRDKMFIR
jgi:hypothetical protein